jgi:hypothetical protein
MIRKEYIKTLSVIDRKSPYNYYDNKQLIDMANISRIKNKFNQCVSYDLFKPDNKKQYSILNTDDKFSPGIHWVAVYQNNNDLYVYDSFARTSEYLMKPFEENMNNININVIFVNKKSDQSGYQTNCGMRCFLWLLFVDKYGLNKCIDI